MDKEQLRNFYYKFSQKRRKFSRTALLKKKFKLKDIPSSHKKFIILQIDGLSYSLLQKLRRTRFVPFLKKLLRLYHITKFDPGYPTTTPFVQAGIMYNDNTNIPGFRFLDKKAQRSYNCSVADDARALEEELQKRNFGILTGGSSIGNIFCGDAERSILTVAHLYKTETGRKSLRDIVVLILLHPFPTLRVIVSSVSEFCIEIWESCVEVVHSLFRGKHFNWPFFYPFFPVFRTFINATVREVCTQSAFLEMDRGVPAIYVTFGGYDWISHYRGPESLSAFHLLRQIDADVRKLYKKARKEGYDFYVLSDHGQIPAVPFDRIYYENFAAYVERISALPTKGFSVPDGEWSWTKYLYYKLEYYYDNISLPLRAVAVGFGGYMRRKFQKKMYNPRIDWKNRKQILLFYSSSLAQLYFTDSPQRFDLSTIEKKYPGFVTRLVQHPGVGFVIAKQGTVIEVLHARGRVLLAGKHVEFQGERFLQKYGDEKKLVRQIQYFAQLKYSGDLIINGAFDGEKIVAFESFHFGSHDSIGGKQNDAFFISQEKRDLGHVLNAKELYYLFLQYHTHRA